MAYAALILFKQSLEEIHNPHQEIQSLKEKVCYLLDFLENHPSRNCNLTITVDLERKMRDAACEGEYIIESHFLKSTTSFRKMLSDGIRNLIPDLKLKNSLQEILQEFDLILEECVSNIKDEKVDEPLQPARNTFTAGPSRISSGKGSTAMVGFDGDFIQMKDQLTGSSSHLEIISIVGMGGIGKTTLATNLYNDSLINYHFHIRSWTTVSQNYQRQEILRDLQRNFSSESHQTSIDQLEENVYKSLKGRRYLIVMDDVWETKVWDDVKMLFPDDNNGSRIILTTRISDVALYANPDQDYIHHLNLLGLEDSWNLLRAKVYGEEISYPSEFKEIGKKIASNCKGLPLAIVVIGGLLSKGSRTRDYWEYIASNVMRAATGTDDQLMEILSLSYNNLPHHLKACFLYMGAFPEDEEILVSRLIMLWIAEGFLKPHYSKNLEEMAREYLKDLIDRNLVMVGKRVRLDDEIKTCTIHDLLRDLCIQKAREEKFLRVLKSHSPFFGKAEDCEYRFSFQSSFLAMCKHDLPLLRTLLHYEYCFSSQSSYLDVGNYDTRLLRTFLYFTQSFYSLNMFDSVERFRLLRVIDALAIKFSEFPIQIVKLINLRYLALSTYSISKFEIPAAIVKLKNLQTFILRDDGWNYRKSGSSGHSHLEIWGMPQLRHLSFKSSVFSFVSVDSRLDRVMLHLHTLTGIQNLICRKEVFQMLPNLKKLRISYTWHGFKKWSSSDFNSFVWLNKLETLNLSFDSNLLQTSIPKNFGFPMKLKKLTLRHCRLPWNNMKTIGSLPNLQVLKLKENAFVGPTWEPNEGEFLVLKYLLLEDMELKEWKANEAHFPNLQHLSLSRCYFLEEIPSVIGDIPTLQMLELKHCNSSVTESAKLLVEEQRDLGNDTLELIYIGSDT